MKHILTKILAVCAFILVVAGVQAQEFYSEKFNNPGLPAGWSTADPSPNNVLWERCTDTVGNCHANLGYPAFAGTDRGNGFVLVDSDGAGDLASPHISQLTTSAINCSGKSQVFAVFDTYIGVFDYDADQNAVLRVSTNGTDWTTYELFQGVTGATPNDRFSDNPLIAGVDISAVAANQATVYLQWQWTGDYEYWWILDNVRLTTEDPSPKHNLSIGDFFYPVSSYATPASQLGDDIFAFEVNVSNKGSQAQTGVKAYAYVFEADATTGALTSVIFVDSVEVGALDAGVLDSAIAFPNSFAPVLPQGLYAVAYEIVSDSVDQRPNDNFEGDYFEATDLYFAKENGPQVGYVPSDGGDWAVGNYYRMGSSTIEQFKAIGAEFAFAVNAPLTADQVQAEVTLYKINEDVDENFDNFEPNGSSMNIIGLSSYSATPGTESYDLQAVEITDILSAEPGVLLEPGGRYILAVGYAGDFAEVFHAFNEDITAFFPSTFVYVGAEWNPAGFVGRPNAVVRMYLDLVSKTDDTPLPESALQVSPNPATDIVNLKIQFDEPTDATITIADISGRVVTYQDRQGLLNDNITYNVNSYAPGTYLARIATKKGTRTLKFVVQR